LSLRRNTVFSFVSGLAFAVAHQAIASFAGLTQSIVILGIGLSLIVFAIGLLAASILETVNTLEASIAVGLDLAWIIGSILIISLGLLLAGKN
jgi:hypothetical protein